MIHCVGHVVDRNERIHSVVILESNRRKSPHKGMKLLIKGLTTKGLGAGVGAKSKKWDSPLPYVPL